MLETKRTILRPWHEDDAKSCYKYAKNPNVGFHAGWSKHESVAYSRYIIQNVLSAPNIFAIVLKETMEPIGSIGVMIGKQSTLRITDDEGEIGYWIGEPFWGQGLTTEATKRILQFCFDKLSLHTLWCAYYAGHDKSKRVLEKCGFQYIRSEQLEHPILQTTVIEHITSLSRTTYSTSKKENSILL